MSTTDSRTEVEKRSTEVKNLKPSNKNKGNNGKGRSWKNRSNVRQDTFRSRTGDKEVANYSKQLEHSLLLGQKDISAALGALESTQTLKAITICITTRSIGFSATTMIRALYSFNNVPVRGSIYQIYRVYLAMLECKLTLDSRKATAITGDYNYYQELRRSETFVGIVRACNYVPDMLTRMINAVGTVKTDGKIYVPKLAAIRTAVNDPELVIPEVGNVTLTNLREYVVALSNENTPVVIRQLFWRNNPIPGCIWINCPLNPLLQNPDDIIPEDYDIDNDLRDDIFDIKAKHNFLAKKAPKYFSGPINYDNDGSRAQLGCNNMGGLRISDRRAGEAELDYYQRIKLEGNVTEFENLVTLEQADQMLSSLGLFGELPNLDESMYPAYANRDLSNCCQVSQLLHHVVNNSKCMTNS